MKLNCIIVDKDVDALETLSDYISTLSNFKLVNTFTEPLLAVKKILAGNNIHVLFLDIGVIASSGRDFFSLLRKKLHKIIITSSNQSHAFDAFEVEADAFLLKPFSISKFALTMEKLFSKNLPDSGSSLPQENFFFIKSKNDKFNLIKVNKEEIVVIESLQNYISIQTTNKKVIAHLTLTKIKEILKDEEHIIQVHRSFLVSKKYIEEVESTLIKMQGDIKITLGENYRNELLSYIKQKTIKTGRISKIEA